MIHGLRFRFIVASGFLLLTTVAASMWTLISLSRLRGVVSDTVRESEEISDVTGRLSGALEREDDAVLLLLAREPRSSAVLARERQVVDAALSQLAAILDSVHEPERVLAVREAIAAYRTAAERVGLSAPERDALLLYHNEANPLLRQVVSLANAIREQHFEAAQRAVTRAGEEAARAQQAVLGITAAALGIAVAVAWHLIRAVVAPLRELRRGANAIREGRFDDRIQVASRDELGDLAGALHAMAADLAEFKRTNVREVMQAKRVLEATLEALPDAVVLFDADGRVLSMNATAAQIVESAGAVDVRSVDDLQLDGLDVAALASAIRGGSAIPFETDLSRTIPLAVDGRMLRLLPRVVPVAALGADRLGSDRQGAVLLLYDVTDLARLDALRSELVAVASHELQTPLTTLRMTLLMLQESAAELPPREQELVETSLVGVEQLAETVHEFLDLTRIEAGQLRLNIEPVHPAALVAAAVKRTEGRTSASRIRVVSRVAPDVPCLSGDARRLGAVLDNVCSNALKHSPPGSTVAIDVAALQVAALPEGGAQDCAGVSISITDEGPGVPAAYRERIFEKFFRIPHPEGAAHDRGAGIGLYLCRQILELHGGHIACSAGPGGRGTRIRVELPARPAREPEARRELSAAPR